MTPSIRRLLRAAFYLASAAIAALCLVPSTALPPTTIGDKAEHMVAFAVLGLLGGASSERSVIRTVVGLMVFGIAIEVLQAFSPGRSPDALDVLADFIGVCSGASAAGLLRRMMAMASRAEPTPARIAGSDANLSQ